MEPVPCHADIAPYGAYALKAAYQRNMSMALLIAVGIALSAAVAGLLIPGPSTIVIHKDDDGGGSFHPTPPPISRPSEPPISGSNISRPAVTRGTIPKPVPDDAVIDDDAAIKTKDELEEAVTFGPGTGQQGDEDGRPVGGFISAESGDDLFPKRADWIPCEVYPEMVYQVQPVYPREAITLQQEGKVYVAALIDREGGVRNAEVAKSSGVACLDSAAVRGAYLNKFRPGIQNGKPVMVWVTYKVEFSLKSR